MEASDKLRDKMKEFEGFRLKAYRDCAGIPTIGVGHTLGVKMGMSITESQAEALFKKDIRVYEAEINRIPEADTQGKFDALVDFAFNCGIGNLLGSTLMKKIRSNAPYPDIREQFLKWNKSGGIIRQGLVKRREWEAERWLEK